MGFEESQTEILRTRQQTREIFGLAVEKKRTKKTVSVIRSNGEIISSQKGINRAFYKFYANLYKEQPTNVEEIKKYFESINLEQISADVQETLNAPISKEEIINAIKTAKNGKAPGPDGLTAIIYKLLEETLIDQLLIVMNDALQKGIIPKSWEKATITLIPKEGQDEKDVKNYRPISLLNVDYKLFANILAERLKYFLMSHIDEDQAGFLPGRQIRDNIRTVLNVIEFYDRNPSKQVGLFFLDAEKAFDNVNWNFMFELLEQMKFGRLFINAIRAIYKVQQADIVINDDKTQSFLVQKGTRQGCPLSPLLFILVLEVLLKQVREDKQIRGLKHKKYEYKYRAFADDVMFIVEDPLVGMPCLLQKIEEFGNLAGFYVNKKKSKIMCKNVKEVDQLQLRDLTQCEIVKKSEISWSRNYYEKYRFI